KDLAEAEQPSEEVLRKYFEANQERYVQPGTVSFGHVFFSRDRRGDKAEVDAREAVEQLASKGIDAEEAEGYGDPFVLAGYYEGQSAEEVARTFGGEFAEGSFKIKTSRLCWLVIMRVSRLRRLRGLLGVSLRRGCLR
ncbi:MAG: hypothetical protein ACYTEQ_30100, partial [Planctomycetota bacterium]